MTINYNMKPRYLTIGALALAGITGYVLFSKPSRQLNPNDPQIVSEQPKEENPLEGIVAKENPRLPIEPQMTETRPDIGSQPETSYSESRPAPEFFSRFKDIDLEKLTTNTPELYGFIKDFLSLARGPIPRRLQKTSYDDGSEVIMAGPLSDEGDASAYRITVRHPDSRRNEIYIHTERDATGTSNSTSISVSLTTYNSNNTRSGKKISISREGIELSDVTFVYSEGSSLPQPLFNNVRLIPFGEDYHVADFFELAKNKIY